METLPNNVLNTNSIYLPTNQNNFNPNNDFFTNEEFNKMNLKVGNNFENYNNNAKINSSNSIGSYNHNIIHSPRDMLYSGK